MREIVTIREATQEDWELIMAWRSNPLVYEGKYSQKKPLTWEEHYTFMTTRGRWWRWFIILVNDFKTTRKVGVVTLAQLDNWNPEINSYISEVTLNDSGDVERQAVELAIEWLRDKGYQKLHTTVPDASERWIRLLLGMGFVNVGLARKGESTWEKYISDIDSSVEYVTGRRNF